MITLRRAGLARVTYTIGALVRRDFRRFLDRHGIIYSEDKGCLDSQFIVPNMPEDIAAHIRKEFARINRGDAP